jgi:hypothetical protein
MCVVESELHTQQFGGYHADKQNTGNQNCPVAITTKLDKSAESGMRDNELPCGRVRLP